MMDQVTNRLPPGFVWPTVGHPGMVPLWALVGDPNQPRKHFDDDELKELASTMKVEDGGEQREEVTVSELPDDEKSVLAPARYRIVSGERRCRAAAIAGLEMIEIRVKEYKNVARRKLDMYIFNEGRVPLSDIEDARYLAELMYDFDLTTEEELAKLTGKKKAHITSHLALLRLVPQVQALMEPKIPERSRLRMGTALVLSRLDRSVQADYAERMPKGEGVSTRRQVDWIKAEIARTGAKARTRELKPSTVRRSIEYLSEATTKRINEIIAHKAFEQVLENATPTNVEILLGSVKRMLGKVEKLLEGIEAQLSPQVHAATLNPRPVSNEEIKAKAAAFVQKRAESPRAPAPAREVHTPKPKAAPKPTPHYAPSRSSSVGQAARAAPAPSVIGGPGKEKAVTYMGPLGRMVTDKVSQRKYLELWDKRQLKFQVEGSERPSWMPTREGAAEEWDKYCE